MLSEMGQRIRAMRKKMQLSQDDLAGLLNVSRQTISKWETQEFLPDAYNLVKLSKIFNITVDEILTGSRLSKYSSGIIINDLKADYRKAIKKGTIYLISSGILFIINIIILLLYIKTDNLFNIFLWIAILLFATLFSLGVRMFFKGNDYKKEYTYLERLEHEKNNISH